MEEEPTSNTTRAVENWRGLAKKKLKRILRRSTCSKTAIEGKKDNDPTWGEMYRGGQGGTFSKVGNGFGRCCDHHHGWRVEIDTKIQP